MSNGFVNTNAESIETSQNTVQGSYYDSSSTDRRVTHHYHNAPTGLSMGAPGQTSYNFTYQVQHANVVNAVASHASAAPPEAGTLAGVRPTGGKTTASQAAVDSEDQGSISFQTLSLLSILRAFISPLADRQGETAPMKSLPAGISQGTSKENEGESELALMEDPTQLPPSPSSRALSDAYVRTLLTQGHGLPCWEPNSFNPHDQPQGIVPGDVGTYTVEGGLKCIFNLLDDHERICSGGSGHPARAHCHAINGPGRIHTRADYMRGGEAIALGASTETPFKRLSERPLVDVLYEFRCHSSSGAILATPTSADKMELDNIVDLEKYILAHVDEIYKHATSIRSIGKGESLYIVTGCVKGSTWAMAAYDGEMHPQDQTLQLVALAPSLADSVLGYKWTKHGSSRARWGQSVSAGLKDQSLFLLGFKIAFSPQFHSRMEGSGSVDGTSGHRPGDTGRDDGHDPAGPGNLPPPPERPTGDGSSGQGPYIQNLQLSLSEDQLSVERSSHSFGGEASEPGYRLGSFPEQPRVPSHPSDVVNDYVLQETGCEVAICHDDAWKTFLSKFPSSANLNLKFPALESRLHDYGELHVQIKDGVAIATHLGGKGAVRSSAIGYGSGELGDAPSQPPSSVLNLQSSYRVEGPTRNSATPEPLWFPGATYGSEGYTHSDKGYTEDATQRIFRDGAEDDVGHWAQSSTLGAFSSASGSHHGQIIRAKPKPRTEFLDMVLYDTSGGSSSQGVGGHPLGPEEYLRQRLALQPGEPINLWSLPDPQPGQRPPHAYPLLVRLAIHGSPKKRMTLKQIYEAIEDRFEYYRQRPKGAWKGSIRHNLSLNQVFRSVKRPVTDPGKGNYWEVDPSRGEGYRHDPKRKARTGDDSRALSDDDNLGFDDSEIAET